MVAAGDDAAVLEALLIENVAQLDAGNIELILELTELQVKRTLALGNLLPRVRGPH